MRRVEAVLRKEIGLDAASIGSPVIERTVRQRMKGVGLKDVGDYVKLLNSSRAELNELVEAVVVLETWFFRDRGSFTAFRQVALEWLAQHRAASLRILSVPCSSGEEPYSLVITLLDALIPPHRFVLNAADVSARALAYARKAVYGKNSFRGQDLAFRERHFRQTKDGYALNPRVRDCVQFYQDNLLGDAFLVGHTAYDVIVCRNLLIYFDQATQVRALEKLHRLLAPHGMLFVGPAEFRLVTGNGFTNANLTMAFACRKMAEGGGAASVERRAETAPPTLDPRPSILVSEQARAEANGSRLSNPSSRTQPLNSLVSARTAPASMADAISPRVDESHATARRRSTMPSALDTARRLADAGSLDEAVRVCQAHLRQEGPSAEAYYLLGLVRDARGDPQAIEYYRKALYLQPDHHESLLQMSLLLEKNGDHAGAHRFKQRARRVQQRS